MPTDRANRWLPQTDSDRQAVYAELDLVVSSNHFKNSKRYPALLEYLVVKVLDGERDQLKERTLGVEVFNRPHDYDTNADPVVRVTAGEVRKRLAQFYHESGTRPVLEIDLPLGSYAPEFKRNAAIETLGLPLPEESSGVASAVQAVAREARPAHGFRRYALVSLVLLLSMIGFSAYLWIKSVTQNTSQSFWKPLLQSSSPVLVVIPTSLHNPEVESVQNGVDLVKLSHGAYNRISVCDAVAVSRFASVLGKNSKRFDVKEAGLTGLGDLHERSVVLVGAVNNVWTMRLLEPLRFHFVIEPAVVRIADSQNPDNKEWAVNYTKPYAYALQDYAIIARYNDPTTQGSILIIAGIGAHATQAASEFVTTPGEIEQIRRMLPAGWENKNLEMIVATNVISGESGPPRLVAAATW